MSSDTSSAEDAEELRPPARRRRRQWLQGQPVSRSTFQRWTKQGLRTRCESPSTSDSLDEPEESDQSSTVESGDMQVEHVPPEMDELENIVTDEQSVHSLDDFHLISELESENDCGGDGQSASVSEEDFNVEDADIIGGAPVMAERLYHNSRITKGDAVCSFMELFSKHHFTKQCARDLVKFIHNILPQGNSFPRSYYLLMKEVQPFVPPDASISHNVCKECGIYIGDGQENNEKCEACECTAKLQFYELPLASQIKYLFEKRNLAKAIDSYNPGNNSDIVNSEEYRILKEKMPGRYDLCLFWNTDGVRPHKVSKKKLWPLMYSICEVAPQWRHFYTLVTGIWYNDKTPDMNSYLQPFVKSLKVLADVGVQWVHPQTKAVMVSKVIAPVFSVDAPARAMLQNIHYYSGAYSCNNCEIPGVQLKLGPRSSKRIFPFPHVPHVLRSKERMKEQAKQAEEENKIVMGVKGRSILSVIPHCDTGVSVLLEYMHLTLLGCVRQFFEVWFTQSKSNAYIGQHSSAVTQLLKGVKRPSEITRSPKDVASYKMFKASDWRAWLLFLSVIVLDGKLSENYYQHWLLLVIAIHTLLQDVITANDIDVAEQLLNKFVHDTEILYGDREMTYNLHGLLHLGLNVRRWGGLWATSAFKFESFNGYLNRILHGTYNVSTELMNNLTLSVGAGTLKYVLRRNNSPSFVSGEPYHLKTLCDSSNLSALEREVVVRELGDINGITFYARALIKCKVFTSEIYAAEKAADNKTVRYVNNNVEDYGVVKCYMRSRGRLFALLENLIIEQSQAFKNVETNMYVKHIIPVLSSQNYIVVPLENILSKVFKVHDFVCIDPNHYEQML